MTGKKKLIRLNQLDFLFFAVDEAVTAFTLLVTVRFKTPQSTDQIRAALRFMLSVYPRLRSVVEPTFFSYKLKILDDSNDRVNTLFNDAFRVQHNTLHQTDDYFKFRRAFLNEPFSLEQGLPIKMLYLPDDPKPILFLSVHHMVCDGMGWIHLVGSLLSYLNGEKPPILAADNPSLTPVLVDKPFYKIPFQLYKSVRMYHRDMQKKKNQSLIHASSRPMDFFGPVNMHQQSVSVNFSTIINKCKEVGVSITVLLIAALHITFSRHADGDEGNTIGVILSLDTRPYFEEPQPVFGNYAITGMIRTERALWDNPRQLIEEIRMQLDEHINRIQHKKILFPMLIDKLNTFVGRKNYSRFSKVAKKRGLLTMTCALSNLGNLNRLNTYGERAQVCEAIATVPHPQGLFITVSGIDGQLNTNFTFQESEFSVDEVKDLVQSFEMELGRLCES